MNKQGLSDIVTAVLLILLIIIAVGLIWLFVRPTVNEVSRVASAQDCLLVETEPISCVYSGEGQYWYASVRVKRGADQKELSDLKLIFENALAQTITKKWTEQTVGEELPQPLETSVAGFALGDAKPQALAVSPILSKEGACNPAKKIACTEYEYVRYSICASFTRTTNGKGYYYVSGDDYDQFVYCYEEGPDCMYNYDPELRKRRLDVTKDGIVTSSDFNAFVQAYVYGDATAEACEDD